MELQEINISEAKPLLFEKSTAGETVVVECSYIYNGASHSVDVHVTIQGDRSTGKPFITFHDIGMNHVSNFSSLFNSEHMESIRNRFCVYHIDAPGMQENAPDLSKETGFAYPSIENLSDMVAKVFTKFSIKEAICIGCGLGANVLTRFAMKNPTLVDGLIAVNATRGAVGNLSWLGSKITNWATPLHEQLLNYHFSKEEVERANHELVEAHRKHLQNNMNANNVQLLLKEYERRTEINVFRTVGPTTEEGEKHSIPCSTLLLVGDMSPFVEEVVELNSRLNPRKTTFLKMADAGGMILEEQTFKVAEAITYFLQGLGYIPSVIMSRLARSRTYSGCSTGSQDRDTQNRIRTLSGGSMGKDVAAGDTPLQKPIIEEVAAGDDIIAKTSDKARLVTEGVC
ncbi:protein NDRG3-like [Styela clava]